MTRYRCDIEVDPGNLWVGQDALGQVIELERQGYTVLLRFPPAHDSEDDYQTPTFSGSREQRPGEQVKRGVRRILVSVHWEDDEPSREVMDRAALHVKAAREIARTVVRELIDWIRVLKRQTWLPEHVEDITLTSPGGVAVDATNEVLPMVVGLPIVMYDRPRESEIDAAFVAVLRERLATAAEVPIAHRILADASYFTRRLRPAEAQRAILLAAIATELRVKDVLRAEAGASRPLVDVILENPRDVSVAAVNLFHRVMGAVVGRSLHAEDANLYRAIELLFKRRNDIAHRGVVPDPREARALVDAAFKAFQWLDTVKAVA